MPRDDSFGPPFNRAGGGYFAMERTNTSIKLWFWSRESSSVPFDVRFALPIINTRRWGLPDAHFNSDKCDIETKFKPAFVLINLTLCGRWYIVMNWRKARLMARQAIGRGVRAVGSKARVPLNMRNVLVRQIRCLSIGSC